MILAGIMQLADLGSDFPDDNWCGWNIFAPYGLKRSDNVQVRAVELQILRMDFFAEDLLLFFLVMGQSFTF